MTGLNQYPCAACGAILTVGPSADGRLPDVAGIDDGTICRRCGRAFLTGEDVPYNEGGSGLTCGSQSTSTGTPGSDT